MTAEFENARSKHVIRDPRAPQRSLGLAGRCIYCYRASPEVNLTREHIIPDGLGGDLYVPEASCIECAQLTNGFERHTITNAFRYGRGLLGIRSRKRRGKNRDAQTYLAAPLGQETLSEFVAHPDMPWMFTFLSCTGRPNMLERFPVTIDDRRMIALRSAHIDWSQANLQIKVHQGHYWRMVAKIAHAYAVATLGLDGFEHRLVEFICNPVLLTPRDYMGVLDGYDIGEGGLHWIELVTEFVKVPSYNSFGFRFVQLAIVRLKLFAPYGAPTYEIIAGEVLPKPG